MQKLFAKIFYWAGTLLFIGVVVIAVILKKAVDLPLTPALQNSLIVLLGVSTAALCLGIVNFSVYFIRHGALAPEEVRIPRKYYLVIVIFLALLGLSAI
ncbi:MAG: hypothetical protein WC497_01510 [Patescibacteria group bacterium]